MFRFTSGSLAIDLVQFKPNGTLGFTLGPKDAAVVSTGDDLTASILAFVGTAGPLVGDMRLQRIGILGYAVVMPVAFFLLARFFRGQLGTGSRVVPRNTA